MTTPPRLADRPALARNRARVDPAALYLHEEAILEVQERLAMVNRRFTAPAIVTPFADLWQNFLPDAQIIPDNEVLDLQPEGHDLVIHALCLHWADDPVGQLVQCRRALKPDGLLIALTFGGQTLADLRAALAEAEAQVTGGLSPRVLPMAEIRDLGALLQRAGFALPVADSFNRRVSHRDGLHLMHDLRAMGEGNALAGRLRHFTRRKVLLRAASALPTDTEGRVVSDFEVICLTGWAPHESQQKPLRPGSAITRLEDALKAATKEGS